MGEMSKPTGANSASPPEQASAKRTYKPPTLLSYGTLRDITLHVGAKGKSDNNPGGFPTHYKTG
jgi:hypothetical protein